MTTLFPGQQLTPGQTISANNPYFTLIAQTDGNVVLYEHASNIPVMEGRPLWATNTDGITPRNFVMQTDGNLVLYSTDGQARWASGTYGNPGAFLNIQDNGRIVVYRAGSTTPTRNNALWTSDLSATGSGNYVIGYYKQSFNNINLSPPNIGANAAISFSGYAHHPSVSCCDGLTG